MLDGPEPLSVLSVTVGSGSNGSEPAAGGSGALDGPGSRVGSSGTLDGSELLSELPIPAGFGGSGTFEESESLF